MLLPVSVSVAEDERMISFSLRNILDPSLNYVSANQPHSRGVYRCRFCVLCFFPNIQNVTAGQRAEAENTEKILDV